MEQQEYRNTTDYFKQGWKDALREAHHSQESGEWSPTLRAFWIKEAEADRKSFKHRCPHLRQTHTYHAGWIAALKSYQCQNEYFLCTQEPEYNDEETPPLPDADEQEGRNMVLAFLFGIAITLLLCFIIFPFWFGALLGYLSIHIILWLWTKPGEKVFPRD